MAALKAIKIHSLHNFYFKSFYTFFEKQRLSLLFLDHLDDHLDINLCHVGVSHNLSWKIAWQVKQVTSSRSVSRICISTWNNLNAHASRWTNDWSTDTSQWYIPHWRVLLFDLGNFIDLLEGHCANNFMAYKQKYNTFQKKKSQKVISWPYLTQKLFVMQTGMQPYVFVWN